MKNSIAVLVGIALSFPLSAHNEKPVACKEFQILEIRQPIKALDQNFQWNNPDCSIVATKSVFPKKDKNGKNQFEKGVQIFIYEDNQLKFICLPGWICKSWR